MSIVVNPGLGTVLQHGVTTVYTTVGQRVSLYVSTPAPTFRAVAYRMGWYGGAGGRKVWSSPTVDGVDQPTCPTDPKTRTVSCTNWSRSLSVGLTRAWVSGEYLIKLVPSTGSASYVPLVVRDDASHAAVLVVSSVTTTQAYNTWGGHSLYTGDGTGTPGGRAYVVSFDRPYGSGWAQSGSILGDTWDLVTMLESQGADVTYATDIDLHQRPTLLEDHKVIISGSHDEYYSSAMRSGLLGAPVLESPQPGARGEQAAVLAISYGGGSRHIKPFGLYRVTIHRLWYIALRQTASGERWTPDAKRSERGRHGGRRCDP